MLKIFVCFVKYLTEQLMITESGFHSSSCGVFPCGLHATCWVCIRVHLHRVYMFSFTEASSSVALASTIFIFYMLQKNFKIFFFSAALIYLSVCNFFL